MESQDKDKIHEDKYKTSAKIKIYQDLIVWQRSHKLALSLYSLSRGKTKSFADFEIWKQIIRSSFSVPANIVEGFHSHRGKSFASHLEISRGSAGETQYWIQVLAEIGQIKAEEAKLLIDDYQEVIAMLTVFIQKIRK